RRMDMGQLQPSSCVLNTAHLFDGCLEIGRDTLYSSGNKGSGIRNSLFSRYSWKQRNKGRESLRSYGSGRRDQKAPALRKFVVVSDRSCEFVTTKWMFRKWP